LYKWDESKGEFEALDTSSTFSLRINSFSPLEKPLFKVKATFNDNWDERISWSDVFDTQLARPELEIPNLVTVNGDGKNDFFEIPYLYWYANPALNIYDRWGKEVYSSSQYANNWDAKNLSEGIYYFTLSSEGKAWKGWVLVKN
jgi:gliding motility-associated-like protein